MQSFNSRGLEFLSWNSKLAFFQDLSRDERIAWEHVDTHNKPDERFRTVQWLHMHFHTKLYKCGIPYSEKKKLYHHLKLTIVYKNPRTAIIIYLFEYTDISVFSSDLNLSFIVFSVSEEKIVMGWELDHTIWKHQTR